MQIYLEMKMVIYQPIGYINLRDMKLVIILICLSALVWYILFKCIKGEQYKLTYIYPKTGHKYLVLDRCKIKSPETGEWHDAYYYKGLDDNNYYAREQRDFVDKFISLKDWENGNEDK